MARFNNAHSRLVMQAKIFLPLIGLSLLATVFLFARDSDVAPTIPYAQVELEALAKEQRLDGPSYATVTKDGAELEISSARVRPSLTGSNVINASDITGKLVMPDSATVTLQAQNGAIDSTSRIAELSGQVHVETTSGYTLLTDRIATMLDFSKIESPGPVAGQAPFGDISAGSMEITQDSQSERYLLVFKERVTLVYQP
jgi:lipopolysaccharide export system protein LptC